MNNQRYLRKKAFMNLQNKGGRTPFTPPGSGPAYLRDLGRYLSLFMTGVIISGHFLSTINMLTRFNEITQIC